MSLGKQGGLGCGWDARWLCLLLLRAVRLELGEV